jgi:hypothetical protein
MDAAVDADAAPTPDAAVDQPDAALVPDAAVEVPDSGAPPPVLSSVEPTVAQGGQPLVLTLLGGPFETGDVAHVDGNPQPTTLVDVSTLHAEVAPLRRGMHTVTVARGMFETAPLSLSVGNTAPVLVDLGTLQVAEETCLDVLPAATDFDGDVPRLHVLQRPPGAQWFPQDGHLRFCPDFIQGGQDHPLTVRADDGTAQVDRTFTIHVLDTITPPAPTIDATENLGTAQRLRISQRTDAFLDSPGYAGRSITAYVMGPVQAAPRSRPVRVLMHGFGGVPSQEAWDGEYRIAPSDGMNSYWWGCSDQLPSGSPTQGTVPPYTQRRVLALLEWVLRQYPGADPERVYLDGISMGGAGAMLMGTLHARHFAWVSATIGQAVARNHRPSRLTQLSTLWGTPEASLSDGDGMNVWDRQDLTRILRDVPEARDQFLFTKHGKDDTTIHFGAVVMPSALTGSSYYQALQQQHVGHLAVWDEGGHGIPDPILVDGWWQAGWNPIFDTTSMLRRSQAFPAFSACSVDRNPGNGNPNGRRPWNAETGYAADVTVPEDTGWNGQGAGALNRFLRWDSTRFQDTPFTVVMPLRVLDGTGGAAPRAGYPTTGDRLEGTLPVRVDVTPRRLQAFACVPGETVHWVFGTQHGDVVANALGEVTVPAVELTTTFQDLVLTRP